MEEHILVYLRNTLSGQQTGNVLNMQLARIAKVFLDSESLVIKPLDSHSSQVFLLSSGLNAEQKFILKLRDIPQEKKRIGLKTEADICLELSNGLSVGVPETVLYGVTEKSEVALYGYKTGMLATDLLLNENQIKIIWSAILEIQDRLILSEIESVQSLVKSLDQDYDFSGKIVRHTSKLLNVKLDLSRLGLINQKLNSEKMKGSRTILSDRSPANWVMDGDKFAAIDFDLVLAESCLGDFVLFIDDYRLSVPYNRKTLIGNCLDFLRGNSRFFTEEDFHWSAINRNLLQGALLYANSKKGSLFSYQRALESSIFLKAGFIQQEIRKILYEVAWT